MDFNVDKAFKALADVNRISIVKLVAGQGRMCAQDILKELPITQPTLSHHMKELVNCGLIKSEKEGRWCYYTIDTEAADVFKDAVDELLTIKS